MAAIKVNNKRVIVLKNTKTLPFFIAFIINCKLNIKISYV
jgi:hypothetical protein